MCGRFTLATHADEVAELLELTTSPDLVPRYNIAPTQSICAVTSDSSSTGRVARMFHWGFVPGWAKDPSIGARMINARAETVVSKPSFRSAFRRRRCLIPADGFYEWQKPSGGTKGRKQPYYIRMIGGGAFALAGLWEHWECADGSSIDSCTIITTQPNELVKHMHDRMPVILHRADHALWLDPEVSEPARIEPLLVPYSADLMEAIKVSTLVNSASNDVPECRQ